jgi:hypothetical protein
MDEAFERYQRCAGTLSTESGGETILVKLSDGRFFGLGETGTQIWARLAQPCTMGDLMETLEGECTSFPESAAGEMAAFLEELRREGLVEPAPEGPAEVAPEALAPVARTKHVYAAPRLDRGTLRQAASGDLGYPDGGFSSSGIGSGFS